MEKQKPEKRDNGKRNRAKRSDRETKREGKTAKGRD